MNTIILFTQEKEYKSVKTTMLAAGLAEKD